MDITLLKKLHEARRCKRLTALVTNLDRGSQVLIFADQPAGLTQLSPPLREVVQRCFETQHSRRCSDGDDSFFVHVFSPPRRLILVGAVHIAQALSGMAGYVNLNVTVLDPRRAFATESRFPSVRLVVGWPQNVMADFALDEGCAVVTLTHDPKIDDPALVCALRSRAFYIGSLGSRRTHQARVERLTAAGFQLSDLQRIHAPVGLNIGAQTPAEIALAILAEIMQVYRTGTSALVPTGEDAPVGQSTG